MARLTKIIRQMLLDNNDGFSTRTYYEGKNSREERIYTVKDGQLKIRATGKTSWADSHYDNEWIADEDETHRFLYKHQGEMNTDGIE